MSITPTLNVIQTNNGGYNQLVANAALLNEMKVKVGFPEGAKVGKASGKGSGHKPYSDLSEVTRIAVWNEFGVPDKVKGGWKIPPRPFFRNALDKARKPLPDFQDKIIAAVTRGKMTALQALDALGIWMSDRIKRSIRETLEPPNAESTKAAKGSSHPLIDTGQLINSVTFVKMKGEEK